MPDQEIAGYWRASVAWPCPPDRTATQIGTLVRALRGVGGVSMEQDGALLCADLSIDAPTIRRASDVALAVAATAYLDAFGMDDQPTRLRIERGPRPRDFDDESELDEVDDEPESREEDEPMLRAMSGD